MARMETFISPDLGLSHSYPRTNKHAIRNKIPLQTWEATEESFELGEFSVLLSPENVEVLPDDNVKVKGESLIVESVEKVEKVETVEKTELTEESVSKE